MSFHTTCQNITVDDHGMLRCRAKRDDDTWTDACLNLDGCVGNKDGRFAWDGMRFSDSASSFKLQLDPTHGGARPTLRGTLVNNEGEKRESLLCLDERIANEDGQLVYMNNFYGC